MYVLVVNAGSSSLKYQLFDMESKKVMAKGLCDRIGLDASTFKHKAEGKDEVNTAVALPDHSAAVSVLVKELTDPRTGCISDMGEISAVGHRVVHGGPWLTESTLVDDEVMRTLEKCCDLAPLHTRPHIQGIEGCKKIMPSVPQVIVVDTAFHQTMPDYAYMYPLPYELYEKYKIRRYGFHGTSHRYVSEQALELLGKKDAKIVTCHLGNGSSISAVDAGRVIDTSMGFTPLEGVIMGSRCGTVDPAIIPYIMEKEKIPADKMGDWMNKECGFKGLSGVSSDLREIADAIEKGNQRAKLALDILIYQIKKYIGSYAAAMNGLDCVVFTAGIGENNSSLREKVLDNMKFFGIKIDSSKNNTKGEVEISAPDSRVKVYVIPTNEELVIATDTKKLVENKKQ